MVFLQIYLGIVWAVWGLVFWLKLNDTTPNTLSHVYVKWLGSLIIATSSPVWLVHNILSGIIRGLGNFVAYYVLLGCSHTPVDYQQQSTEKEI